MKVTVFGATGAIGRLVVDDLLQAGHDVVAGLAAGRSPLSLLLGLPVPDVRFFFRRLDT